MSGASQIRGGSSPWDPNHPEIGPAPTRRFQIQQCLGRGGFGEVYRATMTSTGGVRTEVAIKVLRSDLDPGSDSVRRLRDEGRLLGVLSHPAILRVHDLVLLEGRVALVTEYVEGEDLDTCLAADPRIPIRCLVGVLGEVASALDVAWNAPSPQGGPMHLVHRDVKPANIRLGRHGEVKLLDFGIARATNLDREAQTANNAMLGSYLYMAPERYHEESVAPPSDMYALGCILFEGLTGNRLFDGMTLKQIYGTMLLSRKLRTHLDERLKLVPAETPEGVRDLMLSLLEPDPDARPVAKEVARKTEDLIETLAGPTLKRWARSREWAPPAHIVGSLDGRELAAASFDTRAPDPDDAVPAPDRTPAPAAPSGVSFTAVTEMLPLPSPGGASVDAPIPGLVTRPNVRPSPDEIARAQAENLRETAATEQLVSPTPSDVLPPVLEFSRSSASDMGRDVALVSVPPVPTPLPAPVAAPPLPAPVFRAQPPQAPRSQLAAPSTPAPLPVKPDVDAVVVQTDTGLLMESWFKEGAEGTPAPPEPRAPAIPAPVAPAPAAPPPVAATRPRRPEIPMQGISSGPSLGPILAEVPYAPEPIPGVVDGAGVEDDDTGFERQLRQYENQRRRRVIIGALLGSFAVLVVVTLAAGWYAREPLLSAWNTAMAESAPAPAPVPPPAPPPVPVDAEPVPVVPAAPAPPTEIQVPEPTPVAPAPHPKPVPKGRPAPKPKPKPAPAPAPAAPAPSADATKLISRGWDKVDSDAGGALSLFEQAISLQPKSAEAHYGRGYSLMRLSRKDEAVSSYCKAIGLGDTVLRREIRSVMQQNGMACP